MSQPRPLKLHHFQAILIWWHIPFKRRISKCGFDRDGAWALTCISCKDVSTHTLSRHNKMTKQLVNAAGLSWRYKVPVWFRFRRCPVGHSRRLAIALSVAVPPISGMKRRLWKVVLSLLGIGVETRSKQAEGKTYLQNSEKTQFEGHLKYFANTVMALKNRTI